ncbi:MAG: efflux RND transporter periplasmic adaptor subunit [Asticcacaulis sp.]|uniref:efflux RND transporter periplasmic adaptor subunit n=1 Tax=Asticcacaulis sp. TaxID=1872648 RepID=UPI0039E34220
MWYKNKRFLTIAGIVVALLVVLAIWLVFFNKPKPPELVTQAAAIGNVEKTVLATGTLVPFKQVSVGAQVSGQLTKLAVALGDTVHTGDLIAEIDSKTQTNSLQTAEAEVANIQAQRASAQATLAEANSNFARQQTLYKADAGSKADYDTAVATLKSAQGSLAALDAQIKSAQVSVNTANVNLGYTRIVAPIDGTVIAIVTKEGQTVNANQSAPTIVGLGQLDKMTIKAEVSEADVANIKPGMEVYFTTLGDPDKKYYATLRSIEPAPTTFDPDTTTSSSAAAIYYYALFDIDNPDGILRTNMTAQVYIILQSAKNVLTIPSAALGHQDKDGNYIVMVANPKEKSRPPEPRKVKIGVNDGTNVQVLSGIKSGEQVVVAQATAGDSASSASAGGRRGMGGPGGPPGGL